MKYILGVCFEFDAPVGIIDNEIAHETKEVSLLNYPNPFNPSTTISCELPVNVKNVVIEIFSIKGEKLKELPVVTPSLSPGMEQITIANWYHQEFIYIE